MTDIIVVGAGPAVPDGRSVRRPGGQACPGAGGGRPRGRSISLPWWKTIPACPPCPDQAGGGPAPSGGGPGVELEYETVTDFGPAAPAFRSPPTAQSGVPGADPGRRCAPPNPGAARGGRAGGPGDFYCAVCDGPFYPNRPVAVVGAATPPFRTPCFWPGPALRSP